MTGVSPRVVLCRAGHGSWASALPTELWPRPLFTFFKFHSNIVQHWGLAIRKKAGLAGAGLFLRFIDELALRKLISVGEMTHQIKCLLCKCENLSLDT